MAAPARTSYSDTFAYEPTNARERVAAAGIAVALVMFTALALSLGGTAARLPAFGPASEAFAVIGAAFTAWTLGPQFRIRPNAPLGVLGIAYALYAMLQAAALLGYPGPAGVYFSAASLAGFEACAFAFVFLERRGGKSARWHAAVVRRALAAAGAYALLTAIVVVLGGAAFAPAMRAAVPLLGFVALALGVLIFVRNGPARRIDLWLPLVLASFGLGTFAGGIAGGALTTFAGLLFFCVIQAQLGSIMRRSRRNGERALALQEIASVGTEFGADQNRQLLERAMVDMEFDWAALAHVEAGWLEFEAGAGAVPYDAAFRAPVAASWQRAALSGCDLSTIEEGGDVPWIDQSTHPLGGWSTLVTMPVFIDDRLYGALVFANTMRRRESLSEGDAAFLRLVARVLAGMIERRAQRRALDRLAYNDALTGLPNRAMMLGVLQKEMAASRRYERRFAVHFLDLDGFKAVNDSVGHLAGDEVLREAARRIGACVRASDTVARMGGDEFVVLQPDVGDMRETIQLQVRLRKAFAPPIVCGDDEFAVGVSVGTSRFPQDGAEIHDLLDRADSELYRQKARRRRRAGDRGPAGAATSA